MYENVCIKIQRLDLLFKMLENPEKYKGDSGLPVIASDDSGL